LTSLDNGRRSPRKLLRAVVARLLGLLRAPPGERLFAPVDRERITRPPEFIETILRKEWERVRLAHPDFLVLETNPEPLGGVFLTRFQFGDGKGWASRWGSWCPTISEAQQQAADEYELALGDWRTIPPDVRDARKYALRALNNA
jgi:hypothetical protein